MANEVDALKKRVKQLEDTQSFTIKEGEIKFIHPPESPTANFTKIDVGLDCSQIISGKVFKDFVGFTISAFNKELFKDFDQTGTPKVNVGDKIKFMMDVGSYQIGVDKKHDNRPMIINNSNLVKYVILEKSEHIENEEDVAATAATAENSAEKSGAVVDDDLPF